MRVKLDQEALGLAGYLERVTHARVKDCFKEEGTVYFVVAPGEIGKAIGKEGRIIKRIQEELGKPVRVLEYRSTPVEFVRNLVHPLLVKEIVEENGTILIKDDNKKTKSLLIGRDGRHLMFINKAVQRFFDVEVKVT